MPIAPGARLGPYEVVSTLGTGGMGEVYRATDTKLGRDVAIQVLPASVAHDPDRLARFDREARTLASLNHPHIAAIYGVEESGDTRALAMELAEGPTLADRIAQGPMAWSGAQPIAPQIADALAAAHEQRIVHRDLKPANIKVRGDGTVKVLDFGLAKALDTIGHARHCRVHDPRTSARPPRGPARHIDLTDPEQPRAGARQLDLRSPATLENPAISPDGVFRSRRRVAVG